MGPTVSCPRCGAPVAWGPASRYRPFCSERCRTIDLGGWAMEKYKVPSPGGPQEDDPGQEKEKGEK
jgi:endogenous inhibitor of DNA gyrase (YacG/DUF329 family)